MRLIRFLGRWQQSVLDVKEERGLLTVSAQKMAFMNTTSIKQLGWINCDRFRDIPMEMKTMITVNEQVDKDVQLFATFGTVQGVLPLKVARDQEDLYKAAGIPKDEKVRLVGIRVKNGKVEAAIYDGVAENMTNVKLNFKTYKLKELRALLS